MSAPGIHKEFNRILFSPIEKKVEEEADADPGLIPKVNHLKTLEKLEERKNHLVPLIKKTKDPDIMKRRMNEYSIIIGKICLTRIASKCVVSSFRKMILDMEDMDVYGSGKTAEEKRDLDKSRRDVSLKYLELGRLFVTEKISAPLLKSRTEDAIETFSQIAKDDK